MLSVTYAGCIPTASHALNLRPLNSVCVCVCAPVCLTPCRAWKCDAALTSNQGVRFPLQARGGLPPPCYRMEEGRGKAKPQRAGRGECIITHTHTHTHTHTVTESVLQHGQTLQSQVNLSRACSRHLNASQSHPGTLCISGLRVTVYVYVFQCVCVCVPYRSRDWWCPISTQRPLLSRPRAFVLSRLVSRKTQTAQSGACSSARPCSLCSWGRRRSSRLLARLKGSGRGRA